MPQLRATSAIRISWVIATGCWALPCHAQTEAAPNDSSPTEAPPVAEPPPEPSAIDDDAAVTPSEDATATEESGEAPPIEGAVVPLSPPPPSAEVRTPPPPVAPPTTHEQITEAETEVPSAEEAPPVKATPEASVDTAPPSATPPPSFTAPLLDTDYPLLTPEVSLGLNGRIDRKFPRFDEESNLGALVSLGLWYSVDSNFSYGIAYQRTDLGGAEYLGYPDSLDLDYALNALLFGLRAYPWESDPVRLYSTLRFGLNWLEVDASGIRPHAQLTQPGESFQCSEASFLGLSLAGALGVEIGISKRWLVNTEVQASAHQQTSEPIGACAVGLGSTVSVAGLVGVGYRFSVEL